MRQREADRGEYQAIVGSLMYIALATRPDISYTVAAVSCYNLKPFTCHSTAAEWSTRISEVRERVPNTV